MLQFIDEISPKSVLFVIVDRAHSRFFREIVYEISKDPKKLYLSHLLLRSQEHEPGVQNLIGVVNLEWILYRNYEGTE